MTTTRNVALFSAGVNPGHFGFAACANALAGNAALNTNFVFAARAPQNAIGAELRARGYTKATFFGSTPTYVFSALLTDTDALGVSGGPDRADFGVSVYASPSTIATETRTFGSTPTARTIGNLVTYSDTSFVWPSGGSVVMTRLIGSASFWSFSTVRPVRYANIAGENGNCANATRISPSGSGASLIGNSGNAVSLFVFLENCTAAAHETPTKTPAKNAAPKTATQAPHETPKAARKKHHKKRLAHFTPHIMMETRKFCKEGFL